jgi:hypothetical protein
MAAEESEKPIVPKKAVMTLEGRGGRQEFCNRNIRYRRPAKQ